MKNIYRITGLIGILIAVVTPLAISISPGMPSGRSSTTTTLSLTEDPVVWPQPIGVHAIGNVGMTVTSIGGYGTNLAGTVRADPETGHTAPFFEFPYGSSQSYLWGAALWIGGIKGPDTLASLGFDGYYFGSSDFSPYHQNGSVTLIGGPADKQFVAVFTDTVLTAPFPDSSNLQCLQITEYSRSWANPPYDDFVIHELYLQNIGDEPLTQTYVGLYVDADVWTLSNPNADQLGHSDDFAGYLTDGDIPYIIDNDGDPDSTGAWDQYSIRGAIGLILIDSDPPAADTNFNWWIAGYGTNLDWGPQYVGNPPNPPHYFTDSLLGTPGSDIDKYYMLSHNETDYDLIRATTIGADQGWLPLPSDYLIFLYGMDSRFVYSFGPYDIPPGDSIHVVYAFVAGENVHQNPTNYTDNFNIYNPDPYYDELDFSDLTANAAAAKMLYESNYALALQMGPVQGVQLQSSDENSASISWLPREHPDMAGYNVYLKPVPEEQILFNEVFIGDRDTCGMELLTIDSPVNDTTYTINGIEDGITYFVSVATTTFFSEGLKSIPIYFTCGEPAPPTTDPTPRYFAGVNDITIDWQPSPDDDIAHYNVYRFNGRFEYSQRYLPRISKDIRLSDRPVHDSTLVIDGDDTTIYYSYHMEPYAQVVAPETTFTDFLVNEEVFYLITAVDDSGQESDTARTIHIYAHGEPQRDALVFLENSGRMGNIESMDSVFAFYNQALADYDFDYFILADSTRDSICPDGTCYHPCPDSACFCWATMLPYRFVIIDESILNPICDRYDFLTPFSELLRNYVITGGNVVFFGGQQGEALTYEFEFLTRRFAPGAFEYDILGMDSLLVSGLGLYTGHILEDADTLGGLVYAEPSSTGFPELHVDTSFFWWNSLTRKYQFWLYNTPPQTGALHGCDGAEQLYIYHSAFPQTSVFENLPCGQRFHTDGGWSYTFLFHPWNMNWDEGFQLLDAILTQTPTDVANDDDQTLPTTFSVAQNYPNPFNPTTTIAYTLPTAADVTVSIYNILGRKTRTLVNTRQPAGNHVVVWDGVDDQDRAVASGVYFYRVTSGTTSRTRKMVLLK